MMLNATFNNILAISWQLVLFVEESGVPGENHQPAASQTSPSAGFELITLVVICTDCIGINPTTRPNNLRNNEPR